ncbi:MAG: GNAT family N-acetyltransferase [Sphaerochaetaceae bacterium]
MPRVEIAKKEDKQQLKLLWKDTFNEEPGFLEQFFDIRFDPQSILVIRYQEKIVSCLHALASTYEGKDCRYIVGASTLKSYRNRGMMGELLQQARRHYQVPLMLYPAENARPFYLQNGFFNTSKFFCYRIARQEDLKPPPQVPLSRSALDHLYHRNGSALDRDAIAWDFIQDAAIVTVKNAYACTLGKIAVEAGYENSTALHSLLQVLQAQGIESIRLFRQEPSLGSPYEIEEGGMCDQKGLSLIIGEQY